MTTTIEEFQSKEKFRIAHEKARYAYGCIMDAMISAESAGETYIYQLLVVAADQLAAAERTYHRKAQQ
jgi:hypothetical protein